MLNIISQQVENFVRRHELIRTGQHVLVAVSGGADSVALLAVLKELARPLKLRLTVAHLNHKIRGKAADEDARFVRQLARQIRLPFISGAAAVPSIARRSGVSLEMAGRRARYKFFEKAALARGCDVVATAHNADDNAENILLMLLRGCGLQGLAGIASCAKIGKVKVVRPLLETSRGAIEKFLREQKIAWREDLSNRDFAFMRNRVRHELLPLLEKKYNRGIREALTRLGDVLRSENDLLDELGRDMYVKACLDSEQRLNCTVMAGHHPALRRRVLRCWLLINGIDSEKIDFQLINRIDNLIVRQDSGGKISLTGGMTIKKDYQSLIIESRRKRITGDYRVKVNIPGMTVLPGTGLRVKADIGPGVHRERSAFGKYPAKASFSLQMWRRRRILARPWRPGDRMKPYGLNGSKKIQDIFSDAKVPVDLRHKLPIFECGKEIIWIPGYRIAKGWEVRGFEQHALQLSVE